jgi:hypothetical protein
LTQINAEREPEDAAENGIFRLRPTPTTRIYANDANKKVVFLTIVRVIRVRSHRLHRI